MCNREEDIEGMRRVLKDMIIYEESIHMLPKDIVELIYILVNNEDSY